MIAEVRPLRTKPSWYVISALMPTQLWIVKTHDRRKSNMHHAMPHRDPIFCILPPYVLKRIAESGGRHAAESAATTLGHDAQFRTARILRTTTTAAAPTAPRPSTSEEFGVAAAAISPVQRTIYSARNNQTLPGDVVRAEGAAGTGDLATDEAYDALGATHEFYADVFQRDSIDNQGMLLKASVHYGADYNNAFWNGQQMVFGDGDGQIFNRFTIAIDIIGHELTHGVTGSQVTLAPFYQPGALNESIADVFGSMIKQRKLNQDALAADWLIGEGLFTPSVNGVALRSMKDPGSAYDDPVLGKDPQPKHMRDFVYTIEDHAGVHINCSIPNHAFYLLATNLGGFSWEKAGPIWYEALTDARMVHHMGFLSFARLTLSSATRLYGSLSPEEQAVQDAWSQVGIDVN
jgi:Zn-dependent metalloprotease